MPRRKLDADAVKRAAAGQWGRIILSLAGVSIDASGRHGPCPKCGGVDRFRAFDDFEETGGVICNQCFNQRNGDGIATLGWLLDLGFNETHDRLSVYLNGHLQPASGNGRKPKPEPGDHLEWLPWNHVIAALWCTRKPGVTPESILAAGGRLARYRGEFIVVALPIAGPQLDEKPPVGWVLSNTSGGELPHYKGSGEPTWVKMLTAAGSERGLMMLAGLRLLRDGQPAVVWKTEGPTDALALWSILPPAERERIAVVCNSGGSLENVQEWYVKMLSDRRLFVVHDADRPGQAGAEKWAGVLSRHAAEVRNVQLPYPIAESRGKDLRDWIAEGNGFADLMRLAEESAVVEESEAEANEADNDPGRLARIVVDHYPLAVHWREEGYTP